jgi:hypothetical protein
MAGQRGTALGAAAIAAALAATIGSAQAQDSGPGGRHFERFSEHELRMCQGAAGLMQNLNADEVKAHYLASYYALGEGIEPEPIEVFTDRVYLMFHQLSREQLQALADSCDAALRNDDGAPSFTLGHAEIIGKEAFAAFTATRANERYAAEQGRRQYEQEERARASADMARLDSECQGIMDRGVAEATRNHRQAQSEIEVWIRAGAFGSAPGSYDIQNGCNTLSRTISALGAQECPADYANAVAQFRNNFYISFGEGSAYSCQ